jgi:hypothetical protein
MNYAQSDLIVPKALFGMAKDVRRRWRSVTNRAYRDRTWKHVLEDMEFVSLKEYPEEMAMNLWGPYRSITESWQLFIVHDQLFMHDTETGATEDRCPLNWDGLKYPWFVLSALCSQGAGHPALQDERRRFATHTLGIVLQWWDCYCSMDLRFVAGMQARGWPLWGHFIKILLRDLGMHEDRYIRIGSAPPEEAKEMILRWIDDGEIEGMKATRK